MKYVGLGKRLVALLIDGVLLQLVTVLITRLMISSNPEVGINPLAFVLIFAINIGYYVVLEKIQGATLGKQVMGIKVVKTDGSPLDWTAALIRNLLRIVDALPVAYIVGIILINNSPIKQRFGDRIANTVVVDKNSL